MRGLIPEEILSELRDRANIVEVVSGHVGLRKVGRNHVGLCPFHAEKTPSFTINEDRGIFHCFGCGAGGNVFGFLMRLESLAFPEVVERLARRYGVTLPERGEDDPALRVRESLFRLNEKTAGFFQRYLWESADAQVGRAYLEERGINRATAERFQLGFAPESGEALVRRMRSAGVAPELAERLGLIGARRGGGHFDRFRGRVMFPITDASGRVVGFGSRSVPGTTSERRDLPKYLNSPETPLYRKGSHLYGLAVAREAIRTVDRVLVVEGYFDVLALAEAGVAHVVASLGTALTLAQLQVLRRFTRNIVAFFDGDAAGEKAAEKALALFLEAGLWGHAAFLPAGDDPDTFVRREGAAAVETLLGRAKPLLEFYLDRKVAPASTPAERAVIAQEIATWLAKITDPFEYDITVRRAAERLGIGEEMLRGKSTTRGTLNATTSRGAPPPWRRTGDERRDDRGAAPGPPRDAGTTPAETLLLELMVSDPVAAERVDAAGGVTLFDDPTLRAVAEDVIAAARRAEPIDPAVVLSRLDDATAARVTRRLIAERSENETEEGDIPALVDECLAFLRRRASRRRSQAVLREIRVADAECDDAAAAVHLREKIEIDKFRDKTDEP